MYRILMVLLQGIVGCFSVTTLQQGSFTKLCNNGQTPTNSETQSHRFNPAAILKLKCLSECLADPACSGSAVIQTDSSSGSCEPIQREEKKTCSNYPADTAVTVYGNTVSDCSLFDYSIWICMLTFIIFIHYIYITYISYSSEFIVSI